MKTIAGEDLRIAAFVADQCGCGFVRPYTTLGWERNGELVGGVVFNCFTGHDIELTLAGRGTVTRQAMRDIADYVFRQLGASRGSIRTRASRRDIIDQAERIGFKREGYHPRLFGDDDGVSFGMTRDDCRWLD
jgi:hypothetical protein